MDVVEQGQVIAIKFGFLREDFTFEGVPSEHVVRAVLVKRQSNSNAKLYGIKDWQDGGFERDLKAGKFPFEKTQSGHY